LGDPLKGNLLLLYKPLHLEAQQVSTRIEACVDINRHNKIAEIKDDDGVTLTDHQDKDNAFWLSYKGRMGVSFPTATPFDISTILNHCEGLSSLSDPFSDEEIADIVKYMKPNRAPGPVVLMACSLRSAGILLKRTSFSYVMIFMLAKEIFRASMGHLSLLYPRKILQNLSMISDPFH
jgi:hypothetical protein